MQNSSSRCSTTSNHPCFKWPRAEVKITQPRKSESSVRADLILSMAPPTSLNICTLIKRKPRGERSELLLCAPRTIDQSAEILYRPPDINAGFSKPLHVFILSISL